MTARDARAAPGSAPGARSLVVGIGMRPGAAADGLGRAVARALAEVRAGWGDVRALATLDRRAGESGVRELAAGHGWALVSVPAAELAAQDVPQGSARVAAAVGTASVAEAAALAAGGPGAALILPKRIFDGVVVAVASTLAS